MSTPSILDSQQASILSSFALSNVLLAFDYDGTLAPIADTPGAARMRHETRRLLGEVSQRYPCVVISGRALADLTRRLSGIPLWSVFGNHGLEPVAEGADTNPTRDWMQQLRERLPGTPGLVIEDKGHSVTIHYRQVRDKAAARAAIQQAMMGLTDVRALGGIEAISILPREGRHKGAALQQARRQFACDVAIYAGDDETDEDAFGSAPAGQLLSIRVGRTADSKARFCLESQGDIDALLATLLTLRETSPRLRHLRRVITDEPA